MSLNISPPPFLTLIWLRIFKFSKLDLRLWDRVSSSIPLQRYTGIPLKKGQIKLVNRWKTVWNTVIPKKHPYTVNAGINGKNISDTVGTPTLGSCTSCMFSTWLIFPKQNPGRKPFKFISEDSCMKFRVKLKVKYYAHAKEIFKIKYHIPF